MLPTRMYLKIAKFHSPSSFTLLLQEDRVARRLRLPGRGRGARGRGRLCGAAAEQPRRWRPQEGEKSEQLRRTAADARQMGEASRE